MHMNCMSYDDFALATEIVYEISEKMLLEKVNYYYFIIIFIFFL